MNILNKETHAYLELLGGEILFSEGDSISHHVLQGVCTILRADLDE